MNATHERLKRHSSGSNTAFKQAVTGWQVRNKFEVASTADKSEIAGTPAHALQVYREIHKQMLAQRHIDESYINARA